MREHAELKVAAYVLLGSHRASEASRKLHAQGLLAAHVAQACDACLHALRAGLTLAYGLPSALVSNGTRMVPYVTRTCALWARPIEHARFPHRFPGRTCDIFLLEGASPLRTIA